ncbi:MAG: site-specific DNA-methyltransferase [Campylobacterota bacterium]|nr:site-specific DNA-methyltransferase [Campylobacterota bacterium]
MLNLESQDIQNQKINQLEQIQELKDIFPEIFEDGKIDIEIFKNILFDLPDEKVEHYSFNWNGKKDCYKKIKEKTNSTLKLDDDTSIPDGDNVFIEGDNLEVLKLLQNSYHKKVKMIYIDPPYNKDKDFVYSDTWGDSITNYLIQTDQLRDEGYTTSKTNSTGRRHTNWLNMIYPRLWLSRNLLKDDGVIFVSIDDDEVHNLRKVMDEIYGEENFIGQLVWEKKKKGTFLSNSLTNIKEYVIVYSKRIDNFNGLIGEINHEVETYPCINASNKRDLRTIKAGIKSKYKEKNYFLPKGSEISASTMSIILQSDLKIENGLLSEDVTLESNWRYDQKNIDLYASNDELYLTQDLYIRRIVKEPREKTLKDLLTRVGDNEELTYKDFDKNHLFIDGWGTNEDAEEELRVLLNAKGVMDYPKPSKLIKKLITSIRDENAVILDFFAGSGTTAQAVMELNQEDNGNRKYILVQLPEATDEKSEAYKNGYKKISDITKERIKRVIEKLDYKDGFKSYRLDKSNFQVFSELKKRPNDSFEDIVKMLKMSVFNRNIFTQSAKELDIVYEVGLKNGFSLSASSKDVNLGQYKAIKLYEEDREFYFCFADKVQTDIQEFILEGTKLICYDKALTDSTKLNLRENIDLETL